MQKITAQYVGKKLYDTLMAPPPQPIHVQGEDDQGTPVHPDAADLPDLTGQTVTDDDGTPIGRAVRLPDVAVYVVPEPGDDPHAELARTLAEPGMRLRLQMDGDRIAGLVYAPDPDRPRDHRPRPRAVRADDV